MCTQFCTILTLNSYACRIEYTGSDEGVSCNCRVELSGDEAVPGAPARELSFVLDECVQELTLVDTLQVAMKDAMEAHARELSLGKVLQDRERGLRAKDQEVFVKVLHVQAVYLESFLSSRVSKARHREIQLRAKSSEVCVIELPRQAASSPAVCRFTRGVIHEG